MRWTSFRDRKYEWHRWFAWYPRRMLLIGKGFQVVWLELVERQYSFNIDDYTYREITKK